jgi:hypothetical protein
VNEIVRFSCAASALNRTSVLKISSNSRNFNAVDTGSSLNSKFCEKLEYAVSAALKQSHVPLISKFWCDCVLVPAPEQLEKKRVNDKRQILTNAWLGNDGQTNFEMIIHLGKYSFRRYASGTDLTDTIPSSDTSDWIELDLTCKKVELYLL